jgi:hypothetical protein
MLWHGSLFLGLGLVGLNPIAYKKNQMSTDRESGRGKSSIFFDSKFPQLFLLGITIFIF